MTLLTHECFACDVVIDFVFEIWERGMFALAKGKGNLHDGNIAFGK